MSATEVTAWIDNPAASAVATATPAPATTPVKVAAKTAPKPAPAQQAVTPETASLAAAVDVPVPAKQKAAAAGPAEVVAIVPAVSGAPGDGKTSLSEAMKRALKQQGIKLVSAAKAGGAYKIQGQVELGAAENGQQPITIRWAVIDPSGKQMEKTVVQNNKIVAGSLNGPWGDIADQAAGAAASEVTKLLQKPAAGQAQQGANGSAG